MLKQREKERKEERRGEPWILRKEERSSRKQIERKDILHFEEKS